MFKWLESPDQTREREAKAKATSSDGHWSGYTPRKARWHEATPEWVRVSDEAEHNRQRKASTWWRLWDWE